MGGPVTLGDLIEANKLLWVYCCDCGHERDVDPAVLPLSWDTPVPFISTHMKCSGCGYPEAKEEAERIRAVGVGRSLAHPKSYATLRALCGHERDVCRRRGVAKRCVRGKKVPRIQNVRSIHQLQLPPLRSGRRIDTATAPGGTGERW